MSQVFQLDYNKFERSLAALWYKELEPVRKAKETPLYDQLLVLSCVLQMTIYLTGQEDT